MPYLHVHIEGLAGRGVAERAHFLCHSPPNTRIDMANSIVNPRFLVVSLGNPGALYETLHSAGHLALDSLQSQLASSQPAFTTQRVGKKKARASLGPKYMLAQSPTLMNVSGPWASAAWKSVLADKGLSPADVGLVVVHDDLEEDMGVVKIRKWDTSHRGHNGMKSVKNSLRHADWREARWARISVGIGRPPCEGPGLGVRLCVAAHKQPPEAVFEGQGWPGSAEVPA